jgi:hypothetical protein
MFVDFSGRVLVFEASTAQNRKLSWDSVAFALKDPLLIVPARAKFI